MDLYEPSFLSASSDRELPHLVVVGNGMAGVACVEEILKYDQKFRITIFGDETHTHYDRTLLSPVLAGLKPSPHARTLRH